MNTKTQHQVGRGVVTGTIQGPPAASADEPASAAEEVGGDTEGEGIGTAPPPSNDELAARLVDLGRVVRSRTGQGQGEGRADPPGAEAMRAADRKLVEHVGQVTDQTLDEIQILATELANLRQAVEASREHAVAVVRDHTQFAVDTIAAKIVIAEQVGQLRANFQRRLNREGNLG